MKTLYIVAVSSRPPDWLRQAEESYLQQLRQIKVAVVAVKPAVTAQKEAQALTTALHKIGKRVHCVLLDAGGEQMDSPQFATRLRGWLDADAPLVFVIGGASGVAPSFHSQVNTRLSLSSLTFAHAHARLILVEQLFRADCTYRHHPYPR